MRRELDHELALEQRLAHESEVELLQVAQAAVHELGGAAARSGGEVGLLDQADAVAAGGRVEGDARARDAAAHDHDVELVGGERGDRVGAGQHQATISRGT